MGRGKRVLFFLFFCGLMAVPACLAWGGGWETAKEGEGLGLLDFGDEGLVPEVELEEIQQFLDRLNEAGGLLVGLGKGALLAYVCAWILSRAGVLTAEMTSGSFLLGLAKSLPEALRF